MTGVDSAIWLTAGYAVFLILVAHGFDRLARVAARRSDRWRGGDFTYHEDHDAWVCSEDQWLWPMSFDPENRVTRYRAKPTVCNACPVKPACTTSDKGREMTREVDPWPHSEAGRFHRGIACTVVALAGLFPLVALVLERDPKEAMILLATIAFVGVAGIPLVSHFWNTPDGFPDHVPLEKGPGPVDIAATVDVAVNAIADAQGSLIPASRRSVYGSDNTSAGQSLPGRYGARRGAGKSEEHR